MQQSEIDGVAYGVVKTPLFYMHVLFAVVLPIHALLPIFSKSYIF